MLAYNLVKDRLYSCKYLHKEFEWTAALGVVAFSKEHINVFVKPYNSDVEAKDIITDTMRVREKLAESQGINIWNSYMLICPEESIEKNVDLILTVEKDTTALRKYVIYSETDINRIPFLDDTISENVKPKKILEDEYQGSENVKELVILVQELTLQFGGKVSYKKLRETLGKKILKEARYHED
ncbi:ABC-three component system middle component 1 [Planococcus alpniumensis]|uniref:ABC-three component system middle component 1 n=1 Tax=Planococcus alpniumensis TaxID=2708345 RepID=UPI001B8B9802|nr:ABC-three component system middle component 1 [Planococcus sp. MSAK28401]